MAVREDVVMTALLSLSRIECEEGIMSDEAVIEDSDGEEEGEEGEEHVSSTTIRCVPMRPRRISRGKAAMGQRVQRVVKLAGPGQTLARQTRSSPAVPRADAFMTHLPDSPPRGMLSRHSIFQFTGTQPRVRPEQPKSPVRSPHTKAEGKFEDARFVIQVGEADANEEAEEKNSGEEDSLEEQRPEVDESQEEHEEEEDKILQASSEGPHAVDIMPSPLTFPPTTFDNGSATTEDEEEDWDDEDAEEEEDDPEDNYRHVQEARARFEAEQHERDTLRDDLATYVASLPTKCDADGEPLVAFPRNFHQIVALMTAQDLTDKLATDKSGKAGDDPKSWSQILIQNSLAKQQAFGTLDEAEDAADGDGSLAAKIALKMARIRQLDMVLEEKLGKNLYAATTVATKKAKRVNPQEPEVMAARRFGNKEQAGSTSRNSASLPAPSTAAPAPPNAMNYVERNRKIVENGVNATLTRDEELRVKRLLRESKDKREASPDSVEVTVSMPVTVEFRLDQQEKDEIEKLIADKRGVYPSAIIMALDDVPEAEEQEAYPPLSSKKEHRKANVVQETKRERLRRQRLQRIDEELKFLQENESVSILPDDDDDDRSDGCSSERSYMTTTSMLSTASTRSGVTRRQLDQFVANEVTKSEEFVGETKASRDEIQTLLRSLAHLPMFTARPAV